MDKDEASPEPWYAVRCVFSHPSRAREKEGNLYEERITLWKAKSWNKAFELAQEEAKEYEDEDCVFIKATDAFQLFDEEIRNGTEVWSVMRDSHFDDELYIKTFCCSGRERISPLKPNDY